MKDASLLVKDAIIAALQANAALRAINKGRVYDVQPPPDEFSRFAPFTSMGEPDAQPWGNDGYRGCEVNIQIDNWTEASSTGDDHVRVAMQMNAAVVNALWGLSLTVDGASPAEWIVHHPWIDGTRTVRDPDGVTAHGMVFARVQLTPALANH